jgi:hypothetical protein
MFDGAMVFLAMFVLSLLHPGVLLRGPDKLEADIDDSEEVKEPTTQGP